MHIQWKHPIFFRDHWSCLLKSCNFLSVFVIFRIFLQATVSCLGVISQPSAVASFVTLNSQGGCQQHSGIPGLKRSCQVCFGFGLHIDTYNNKTEKEKSTLAQVSYQIQISLSSWVYARCARRNLGGSEDGIFKLGYNELRWLRKPKLWDP